MPLEIPDLFRKTDPDKDLDKPQYTRREIGKATGAGLGLGFAGGMWLGRGLERAFGAEEREEEKAERREDGYEASELWTRELSGYKMLYGELERDEILFVNEEGAPLGEAVKLQPIDGISPGPIDENGFLTEEMNQTWLDRQRERICAELEVPCDLPNELPRQINVIPQLREAVYQTPNEDINPKTYLDLVEHFANKSVIGAEDKTRLEYVRERVGDHLNVPATAKAELILLIPGLAAQESHFNNASESGVGAQGIFQFMPDTWRDFGYTPEDIRFLSKQVEAAGKYFSRAHVFFQNNAGQALSRAQQEYFNGSQEEFEKNFLAPLLLNSYNSGPGRMVSVIKWFTDHYPNRESLERLIGTHPEGFGKDVYQALTRQAIGNIPGYGQDSSQYVVRLSALAELLNNN